MICLCQGLRFTHNTAIKSEHLHGSSAPRTYSIICISSKSCLGSIVGFARLLCFGTLRSATSAKVALGELLRLCPGSSGRAPQWRKPKTDCHNKCKLVSDPMTMLNYKIDRGHPMLNDGPFITLAEVFTA